MSNISFSDLVDAYAEHFCTGKMVIRLIVGEMVRAEEPMDSIMMMMEKFHDMTLADWEEKYPDIIGKSYTPVVLCYGNTVYVSIWTWANSVHYESADRYNKLVYHITDDPIRIDYGQLPCRYTTDRFSVKGSPSGNWLFRDINHMTGYQTDYVAEITFGSEMNWGFNGANAVLIFRELCDRFTNVTKNGRTYVGMKYYPGVGYWFGSILESTMYGPTNEFYESYKTEE